MPRPTELGSDSGSVEINCQCPPEVSSFSSFGTYTVERVQLTHVGRWSSRGQRQPLKAHREVAKQRSVDCTS